MALTTALMNDDLLAVAQVTLTMDTAERLAACMSLATMLSRCCTALGITPGRLDQEGRDMTGTAREQGGGPGG